MYGLSKLTFSVGILNNNSGKETIISNTTDFHFGGYWLDCEHGLDNSVDRREVDFSLEKYYFANTPPAFKGRYHCSKSYTVESVK